MVEWISNEQKYALIGLSIDVEKGLDFSNPAFGVRALTGVNFVVPEHWKIWLGSIRAERVADAKLFLISTSDGGTLSVLDGENQRLETKVWNFYLGLLLAMPTRTWDKPVRLTGSKAEGETDVRQQADIDAPVLTLMTKGHAVGRSDLETACALGLALESLVDPERTGKNWRLVRTLTVYFDACATQDIMDRIHQFTRCLEGLIHPSQGNSKSQFKSRTETFIGPAHHDLIGDIYDVRSAVEHLHENDYMHPFVRKHRLKIFRLEGIVSELARSCLRRVLMDSGLRASFGNSALLDAFWAMSASNRRALWGSPIDPFQTLTNVPLDQISDEALGAET